MRKQLFMVVMSAILLNACTKENSEQLVESLTNKQNLSGKVDVCHRTGNGSYHTINISRNALAAHKAHGDVIPDEDGDGYTKKNPCGIGSQDDCNDTNPSINPGAKEVCGNGIDDNCNGKVDEDCTGSVKICDQTWMAANLDVSTYRDGTVIPEITDPAAWADANYGAWTYYANTTANGTVYGKLYNWFAVNGDSNGDGIKDKELAPLGWHIPTDAEWNTLVTCLGGADAAGGALKASGTAIWASPNTGATNSSGFTALPGGSRSFDGSFSFDNIKKYGFWWSATGNGNNAGVRIMEYTSGKLYVDLNDKNFGFSVRCVKD